MRLTKKGFRAWLEAKKPREIVGGRNSPLETYLTEDRGCLVFVRHNNEVAAPVKGRSFRMPEWAICFHNAARFYAHTQKITAARAIKILDEI